MHTILIPPTGDGHAAREAAPALCCGLDYKKSASVDVINNRVGSTSVLKADEY